VATRVTQTSQNRPNNYSGGSNGGNSVDVGNAAVVRMAREDTRWFIAGVVVLSIVLFFALPLAVLIYVDAAKLQAEVRYEVKQLKKLKTELKEKQDASNRSGDRSEPDQ
jgi:hypothetical protein